MHVGYEGGDGVYGFYLQGGPAYVQPDGDAGEFELSGKLAAAYKPLSSLEPMAKSAS